MKGEIEYEIAVIYTQMTALEIQKNGIKKPLLRKLI